jgi:hypothetical protein
MSSMADTAPEAIPPFAEQYGGLVKEAFHDYVAQTQRAGADLTEQARADAERGKPDLVLALLCQAELPDGEKREVLAHAFERRAELAEATAAHLSDEHNRPFPLIGLEARKDRTMARQVRAGKMIRPYARAPKPLTTQ